MTHSARLFSSTLRSALAKAAWPLGLTCALLVVGSSSAPGQTFAVLHDFTDGNDGARPYATLTQDRSGNMYGTTEFGGPHNAGTVFKLTHHDSNWLLFPLYNFDLLNNNGGLPFGPVTIGPDGAFYGTTIGGGFGGGTVYRLRPPAAAPASVFAPWREAMLHAFSAPHDGNGAYPAYPALIFDQAGNIYGTTETGGSGSGECAAIGGGGVVFQMTPAGGGNYLYNVLYNFDAGCPESGVIFDSVGNLYGTAPSGGPSGLGVVYELSPTQSGWQETVLHAFEGSDGSSPVAGVMIDQAGNLYGATSAGGSGSGGVIYELSPSNGGWLYQVLYNLSGNGGPQESLTMDAAGNLYGTAVSDGANGMGMVFKLSQSKGVWTLTDLHDFSQGSTYSPYGGVTLDANGHMYGTTIEGGAYGYGVVWEITP